MYLDCGINWDYRSDITSTKILSLLFSETLRAHKDGIFHFSNGASLQVKELPELIISDMEKIFNQTENIYRSLAEGSVEKSWSAVFYFFKNVKSETVPNDSTIPSSHWACSVTKSLWNILARFTSTAKDEMILTQYGRWFETEKQNPSGIINFNDLTLSVIKKEEKITCPVKQIQKSPQNNCYFNIPISVSSKVSDSVRERLRLFLSTIYAGNSESRRINMALESLAWYGYEIPQKMIVL